MVRAMAATLQRRGRGAQHTNVGHHTYTPRPRPRSRAGANGGDTTNVYTARDVHLQVRRRAGVAAPRKANGEGNLG
jgi:hypothetical protein